MTVKSLTHPVTGQTFKLGRKRPLVRGPRLKLRNYLYKSLPAPPDHVDWTLDPPILSDCLGNNEQGDCTIAGAFHINGALLADAGAAVPASLNATAALSLYQHLTGGIDDGLDELTVLNWWRENGLLADRSHKIDGWATVNAGDMNEVLTAHYLFRHLLFAFELPDEWIDPMPSGDGFVWDVAGEPNPDNGHCFIALPSYSKAGSVINSWGFRGLITPAAIEKYASTPLQSGLYVVFTEDMINAATQRAANGLDASQLRADLDSFG